MTLPQNVQTVTIPALVTYAGRQNNNKGGNITKLILNKNNKGTMYELPAQQTKLKELVIPDEFSSTNFSMDYCTELKKLYVGSGMVQGSFGLCRNVILDELYISSLKNYLQMPTMEQTQFHSIYIGKPDEIIENKGAYGNVVVDYSWDRLEQERVLVTAEMVSEALKEVTVIKTSAFNGCYTLEGELVIPNTVLEIGKNAFNGCSGLTSITIPNSITSIGDRAFANTKISNSVVIPEGVTTLSGTFEGCRLALIDIPSTCISIGGYTWFNTQIIICRVVTPPTFASTGNSTLGNLYVPDASVGAYQTASGWSAFGDRIKPLSEYVES